MCTVTGVFNNTSSTTFPHPVKAVDLDREVSDPPLRCYCYRGLQQLPKSGRYWRGSIGLQQVSRSEPELQDVFGDINRGSSRARRADPFRNEFFSRGHSHIT